MYEQYHFQAPRSGLARTSEEASQIAAEIGAPVALKIASPDIVHKTDVGGVALDLVDATEIARAFDGIVASVRAACPKAGIEGVEVQEMITRGHEIIIGLLDEPQFGPVIMFGLGGIFTELLHDVSFRVLPIERSDALQMLQETKGYRILQGYRGRPRVSETMLVDLLIDAGRMGMDFAGRLASADFNPIAAWEDQHCVLDFKVEWHDQARATPRASQPNTRHLETFFKASSVALIGASATPGKIGNAVLDSLLKHDYRGRVFPVNPGHSEILGARTYPSLEGVPDPIDLVVVTVDLSLVPALIRTCAAKNIHNMVVVSGGGKELGGERGALEAEIRTLASAHGVRVIGPNCVGVLDGQSRLDTFFQVHERMCRPKAGRIAMLTQSGTIGVAFLEAAADLGVSKFVSYGNRVDVDEADLLAYLADDAETDLIALYVEGLEDGRTFFQAARQAAAKKPVVVFKAGRSERAAHASVSHTGFFGGSYEVAKGAFRQAGLVAVDSYEEFLAACKALAMQPRAKGSRVAMISNGAGTMVQGIDLLGPYALEMPNLSPETLRRLGAAYPPFYLVQNPVDITGSATSSDYEVGIEALLQDPQIDIVMPWFVFQDTPLGEDIVRRLGRLNQSYRKPILVGAIGGPYTGRMLRAIEAEGIPAFESVCDWMAAAYAVAAGAGT